MSERFGTVWEDAEGLWQAVGDEDLVLVEHWNNVPVGFAVCVEDGEAVVGGVG